MYAFGVTLTVTSSVRAGSTFSLVSSSSGSPAFTNRGVTSSFARAQPPRMNVSKVAARQRWSWNSFGTVRRERDLVVGDPAGRDAREVAELQAAERPDVAAHRQQAADALAELDQLVADALPRARERARTRRAGSGTSSRSARRR